MSSIWTIRRSATDVKLTGLCGGVAQHWGVDPLLVRVGWALAGAERRNWTCPLSRGVAVDSRRGSATERWSMICSASRSGAGQRNCGSPSWSWPALRCSRSSAGSARSASGPQSSLLSFGTSASTRAAMTSDRQTAPDRQPAAGSVEPAQPHEPAVRSISRAANAFHRSRRGMATPDRGPHPSGCRCRDSAAATPNLIESWPASPSQQHPACHSRTVIRSTTPAEHNAFLAEPDPVGLYVEPPASAPVKMSDTQLGQAPTAGLADRARPDAVGTRHSPGTRRRDPARRLPRSRAAGHRRDAGGRDLARHGARFAAGRCLAGGGRADRHCCRTCASRARCAASATRTRRWLSCRPLATPRTSAGFRSISASLRSRPMPATQRMLILAVSRSQCPKMPTSLINYTADMGAVRAYGEEVQAGSELTARSRIPDQPSQASTR